ncbi:MAG: hypothetical protein QXT10_04555 [Candidatus Bathyarchaeia archaeon]
MPERTRQVYGYIYKPDNTPYKGVKVEVRLVHPYWGKYYTKQYADTPLITVTDNNGYWTLTLVVNEDYEPYKETYYNVNCYRPEDNKLYMCFSFYLPYGDGTPVNVGTLLVGKGVRQPDLVGWVGFPVRSINHLTGEIYLRAGAGIAINENANTSEITIVNTGVHSVNSLSGHITIDALDGVKEELGANNYLYIKGDWATVPPPPIAAQSQLGTQHQLVPIDHTHEGVHAVNGLLGDITIDAQDGVKDEIGANNYLYIKGDWATVPPPPIAAQSQLGTQHQLVPIDHTHEGVHAINNLVGDVSLLADVGINIFTNSQDNQILIANDPYQVVLGREFEVIRIAGGSTTQTGVDWFNADLGNVSGWVARRTDTNEDVTNILTDNNQSTGVIIDQHISIWITLPNRMVISQLWINANGSSLQVYTVLTDEIGNHHITAYGYISSVSNNLYQATFFKAPAIADAVIIAVAQYNQPPPEIFISEVRVNRGMLFKAPYLGSPSSSAVAMFIGNVFLRSGFTYKLCTYWGMGDYLGDGTFSPPQPEITGRGMIICPNGIEIDLGSFGWKGALAPPYHNAIYCHETIITPSSTGFATVSFILTTSPYTPDYEHAYFLGLILRPQG